MSAIAVAVAGGLILAFADLGPISGHMAQHIASMNVLAPLLAILAGDRVLKIAPGIHGPALLWSACAAQLFLLWAWHLPAAHSWAMGSAAVQLAMHGSLFLAALVFWTAVLQLTMTARWQSILALLITGKLACLLGSLLIFAPRLLYASSTGARAHHALHDTTASAALGDQHLAGLLMIAACPLSYILAGIVIATQTLTQLGCGENAVTRHLPSAVGR